MSLDGETVPEEQLPIHSIFSFALNDPIAGEQSHWYKKKHATANIVQYILNTNIAKHLKKTNSLTGMGSIERTNTQKKKS